MQPEIVLEELLLLLEKNDGARCVSFESHAYINLGYEDEKSLGPGEIVAVTPEGIETLQKPGDKMRICSFLWVYYGYPTSTYEGVNVEEMRYKCGDMLAERDFGEVKPDIVAGVPDSGIAHAIGSCETAPECRLPARLLNTPYLAAFLYANPAEPEKSDRQNEADPCSQTDQG